MSRLDELEALLSKASDEAKSLAITIYGCHDSTMEDCGRLQSIVTSMHAHAVALIAIARAARNLIDYEEAGAPEWLDWDSRYDTLREALDRLETDQ